MMNSWEEIFAKIFSQDFLYGIFQALLGVIAIIIKVILWPFTSMINELMPGFDHALSLLASYFDYARTFMSWILDAFGVPYLAVLAVGSYYLMVFTVSFSAFIIKIILKWHDTVYS